MRCGDRAITEEASRLTIEEKLRLLELLRQREIVDSRSNLMDFTRYTWEGYRVNWHHRTLCAALDRLLSGETKRLLVFMPPRHGKSELVSRRLPAYALGRNPDELIISASYSDDLAAMMNRDVQRIIDSPEYRRLFPDTLLFSKESRLISKTDVKYARTSDLFQVVNHRGQYRSAGVGGGITGMGFTLGIIDDPIKNPQEAASPTIRQRQWEWFTTTFMTRMQKGARVLITLTRWHPDDLAGRILELQKSGLLSESWEMLNLPALNELGPSAVDPRQPGDALWPDDYPVSFLNEMKVTLGSKDFAALYQQRPAPAEGGIIKRDWLRRYRQSELPKMDTVIMSWDCAFDETDTSSYVVGQVWGRSGARFYLLDQVRDRMDFVKTIEAFRKQSVKHPTAQMKLIEKKANGSAMRSVLKEKIPGIVMYTPRGPKPERLKAVSPLFEAGNVYIPVWEEAPWVNEYVEELVTFPNAPDDDQVDTTSQALNKLSGQVTTVAPGSMTRTSPVPV